MRLLVLRGDTFEQEIDLPRSTLRLGRGTDNDIVLDDPGKSVSRDHAEIRYEHGQYIIVDLGSQNGIWVSGVRAPSVVLGPNVVASIGPFRISVDASEGEPARVRRIAAADPEMDGDAPMEQTSVEDGGLTRYRKWLIAAATVIPLSGVAIGVLALVRGRQDPGIVPDNLQRVVAFIQAGDCAAARDELDAALAAGPSDAAAQLKARVDACVSGQNTASGEPGTPLPAESVPVPQRVDGVRGQSTSAQPTAGSAHYPVAASPCPGGTARLLPPEQGGLALSGTCESAASYAARVEAMQKRYDDAIAALDAGASDRAIPLLQGIVDEAGVRYRDVDRRLDEGRRREAARTYAAAHEFEKAGDLERALSDYRHVFELDPSLNVQGDIARVTDARIREAATSCEEGNSLFAYNHLQEALRKYESALKVLPPDHACAIRARQQFPTQLRRNEGR